MRPLRITTDRIRILLDYGLTDYQARVYLALLEFPSVNAGTLAKAAHVPRNRLYEILEDLQGMGLADILLDEETRKYRAKPLTEYLDRRVADLQESIGEIARRKDSLAVAFQPPALATAADLDFGVTRLVIGRRAVGREIDRLLDAARLAAIVAASANGTGRAVRHVSHWAENATRAVTMEIVLPRAATAMGGGVEKLPARLRGNVRWTDLAPATMCVIVDGREMLLVHPIPDDDRVQNGRDFGLHTTNPAMVRDWGEMVRRCAPVPVTDAAGVAKVVATRE